MVLRISHGETQLPWDISRLSVCSISAAIGASNGCTFVRICMDYPPHDMVLHATSSYSKQALFQVMSSEKALLCLAIRDERDGERTECWSSPVGRLGAAPWKSRAGSQKTEGGIITSRTLVMQVLDPFALQLPGGSSPQSALGEPGMGAHILLRLGARLSRASALQTPRKAASFHTSL
jgi:hypothetical protein